MDLVKIIIYVSVLVTVIILTSIGITKVVTMFDDSPSTPPKRGIYIETINIDGHDYVVAWRDEVGGAAMVHAAGCE